MVDSTVVNARSGQGWVDVMPDSLQIGINQSWLGRFYAELATNWNQPNLPAL
jgi:hypothetical protein